jgi:hypothetical protein
VKHKKTKPPSPRKSPNPEQWTRVSQADGSVTFRLASWSHFFDFLEAEVFHLSSPSKQSYIWRGQRRSNWSLSSSLDRLFSQLSLTASPSELERRLAEHLDVFKHAARGRRGPNPASLPEEKDWWALGQHFGLKTPLLDWTRSPFAAAYFAFEELAPDPTDYRVVYGLSRGAVDRKNEEISSASNDGKARALARERITDKLVQKAVKAKANSDEAKNTKNDSNHLAGRERLAKIDFIDPMSDENQRLVSQGGLFTRAPIGKPIEQWISDAFYGSESPVLVRIEIPDHDRRQCLSALDRMNINHLSLFPDLSGASRWTNLTLELES